MGEGGNNRAKQNIPRSTNSWHRLWFHQDKTVTEDDRKEVVKGFFLLRQETMMNAESGRRN